MRALAIVHQADAGPGVFAQATSEAGARLDTWDLPQDGQPPDDPFSYDAVLSLGGAMHPDSEREHPWLVGEKRLLAALVERGVPLLGVCLGAQLLAAASGAEPCRLPAPEIGWHEVRLGEPARDDPLMAAVPPRFDALQWHSYGFPLPPDAIPLAHSETCLQAYRLGELAWGIQFHPEVTLADVESWIDDYRSDPDAARAVDPA
jgi:GMP synthase-like glutamine amidotransferase